MDTRSSNKISPAGKVSVSVRGQAGVPATGVSAVVLNLTVTNAAAGGFITAWQHDVVPRPVASNINFSAGQTIANRAIVAVGASGLIDFYNGGGAVDLVVDVSGWFTDAGATTGGDYFALTPTRFLDTRTTRTPIPPAGVRSLQLGGVGGLPGGSGSPSAVVATITVTNATAGGFLTASPGGGYARPLASDLNWSAGSTVANLVVVALGPSGVIDLYNGGGTADFIVDVLGYYDGPPLPPPPTAPAHFLTLSPGSVLPSGAQCAAWVRSSPIAENKRMNLTANHTTGHSVSGNLFPGDAAAANQVIQPRIDGQFTGTTHEILRWAACKWGIDEDIVTAQAVIESWWHQTALGDFGADPTRCPPGHGLGVDGRAGVCPESYGILQNRYPYEQPTWPGIGNSTAMNADTAYAIWRTCFEGYETWLGSQYGPGDAWGCVGRWFSGRWHDGASNSYIANVLGDLNSRTWETPNFQEP